MGKFESPAFMVGCINVKHHDYGLFWLSVNGVDLCHVYDVSGNRAAKRLAIGKAKKIDAAIRSLSKKPAPSGEEDKNEK